METQPDSERIVRRLDTKILLLRTTYLQLQEDLHTAIASLMSNEDLTTFADHVTAASLLVSKASGILEDCQGELHDQRTSQGNCG